MILEAFLLISYFITVIIIIVTYFLYPFFSKALLKPNQTDEFRNECSRTFIIISAYNEETVIQEKILNGLEYMGADSEIVVVSDGSTDNTNSICKKLTEEFSVVSFYINHKRGGKNSCLNLAYEKIQPTENDILIFTDCNTFFDENSLSEIKTSLLAGASLVAGSMVYESMKSDSAISEGLYWKYEEWIRRTESSIGRLIVCNGGLFGMWADLFKVLPTFVPNDFEAPLRLAGEGRYVVINPAAKGVETAINSPKEEYSRKTRMANRQMSCIKYLWKGLNRSTKIQVLFHKLFRWFGLHLFVLGTANLCMHNFINENWILRIILVFHFIVIGLMIFAFINNRINLDKKFLPKIYHACRVHMSGAKGALNAIVGGTVSVWKQAETNR